jgi:hypothetical protein
MMRRIAHITDDTIRNVSLLRDGASLPPNTMLESEALAAGYEWYRTPEEIAAAARKTWPNAAQFWTVFSDNEKLAITQASHPSIKLLLEELRMWPGEVWSDDPKVQQGLGGLVALGILTPDRKTEILTP